MLLAHLARGSVHGILSGFVPVLMLAAFSLVSLAIILAALYTAFLRTIVIAGPDGIAVTSSLLGLSWTRRAARGEIGDMTLKIDMQVGTTAYYDLKIAVRDGLPLTIPSMLRDKREAEWLAEAIRAALR